MENIKDVIFSQYANSPKFLKIISAINDAVDPAKDIASFYELVYRLSSAKGFALDIWANKVGVSRNAPMSDPNAKTFGWNPDFQPWNTFPFSDGGKYSSYTLPDESLRFLIILKAGINILYATAPNINKLLTATFTRGRSYYKITGHMTAEYVFEFGLNPFERMIVYTLSMLPMPSGVGISYREINPNQIFSFNGSGLSNFNNGVFYSA